LTTINHYQPLLIIIISEIETLLYNALTIIDNYQPLFNYFYLFCMKYSFIISTIIISGTLTINHFYQPLSTIIIEN